MGKPEIIKELEKYKEIAKSLSVKYYMKVDYENVCYYDGKIDAFDEILDMIKKMD